MSKASGALKFFLGAVVGAVGGVVAGVLMAPRAGSETRTMAAEVATDAWGNVVEMYHEAGEQAVGKMGDTFADVGEATDDLRAKVDQARMRMDQIRESLANGVTHEDAEEPASAPAHFEPEDVEDVFQTDDDVWTNEYDFSDNQNERA